MRLALLKEYTTIPVVGFNSAKYDLCFVVNELDKLNLRIGRAISKVSGYMSIDLGNYRFLDVRNQVPPNINLDKFAKM